jgi:hypothetical protein
MAISIVQDAIPKNSRYFYLEIFAQIPHLFSLSEFLDGGQVFREEDAWILARDRQPMIEKLSRHP